MDIIALFCDIDYFFFLLRTEPFNCQFFMIFAVVSRAQLAPTMKRKIASDKKPPSKNTRSYGEETLGRKSQLPEFSGWS